MRTTHKALAVVTAALALTGAVSASAAGAAAEVNGTVVASAGLKVHSGSPTGSTIDTMPYNSVARIYCYTTGASVAGPYGTTNEWDAIDGYTPPGGSYVAYGAGKKVFASDAWINTGGDTAKLVRHC